jgi:hypothetical protein
MLYIERERERGYGARGKKEKKRMEPLIHTLF